MKRLLALLCLLLIAPLTPMAALADDAPPSSSSPSQAPDEIREERHFKSKPSPLRLLELPKYILEATWYPLERFINFSERTDLLNRVEDVFFFNEARTFGWFPNFSTEDVDINGFGISIFHNDLFQKKQEANFSFLYGNDKDELLLRAAYKIPPSEDYPYFFKVEPVFLRDRNVELFTRSDPFGNPILGSETTEADQKSYFMRRFKGRIIAGRKITRSLALSAHIRGLQARTDSGIPGTAPLPPGLVGLREDISLIGGGMGLAWDLRDNPLRSFVGSLIEAEVAALVSPDSTADGTRFGYTLYSLEAQHFIPIYRPHRVILFHYSLRRMDPIGDREIPFFELPVLDFRHQLRSFQRNRFQDRGALSFSLEYRYPIWVTWDAYVFFDGGQVFERYSDIQSKDFRFSEGFGIRFMSKEKLQVVFQFGVGREGTKTIISVLQVF